MNEGWDLNVGDLVAVRKVNASVERWALSTDYRSSQAVFRTLAD